MAIKSELVMNNGDVVAIELGFNPYKCMVIAKDFPAVNKVFSMAVGEDGEEVNMLNVAQSVYVAYRQANMNNKKALSFEKFSDEETGWEFDISQATKIYMAMLNKDSANEYAKELAKLATKAKKGK